MFSLFVYFVSLALFKYCYCCCCYSLAHQTNTSAGSCTFSSPPTPNNGHSFRHPWHGTPRRATLHLPKKHDDNNKNSYSTNTDDTSAVAATKTSISWFPHSPWPMVLVVVEEKRSLFDVELSFWKM